MANKAQVLELHARNPRWSSGQIAEALECDSAYVRATFYRNGLKLNPIPLAKRAAHERERCASIAESMGAPNVASAIRGEVPS